MSGSILVHRTDMLPTWIASIGQPEYTRAKVPVFIEVLSYCRKTASLVLLGLRSKSRCATRTSFADSMLSSESGLSEVRSRAARVGDLLGSGRLAARMRWSWLGSYFHFSENGAHGRYCLCWIGGASRQSRPFAVLNLAGSDISAGVNLFAGNVRPDGGRDG